VAFPITKFRRALASWHRRNGRHLPWRKTRDPYAILVSEFMLQQTQVATVIPYYEAWLRTFPNFASLARASENDVLRVWQGLGYYARARNLHATARAVLQNHRGHFPRSIDRMRRLPGIGEYTAHAVASFAFNQSVPIVEANTARVLARVFNSRKSIDSAAGRKTLWQRAANLCPMSGSRAFNSGLLDLGALICVPRNPKCDLCPVKAFCQAQNPVTLPVRKSRPQTKKLVEAYGLIVRRGRILLERSRHRWRGMWILPPLQFDSSTFQSRPVYKSVFPFTHHRITLAVYRHPAPRKIAPEQQWVQAIEDVPMPSPHRRAIEALMRNDGNFSVQREQQEDTRRSRRES
jgi:A/G-specific adenine glycosylase